MDTANRRLTAAGAVGLLFFAAPALAQTFDADAQRARAEEILSQRTYDPIRDDATEGTTLAERLQDFFDRLFEDLGISGRVFVYLLVAGILIAATYGAYRMIQGRIEAAERTSFAVDGDGAPRFDARQLERQADDAARSGDYATAVRLRFEAGLTRLDERGALPHHDKVTSGAIAATLALPEFDRLAETFDGVAYGNRGADSNDDAEARTNWPLVIKKAPRP